MRVLGCGFAALVLAGAVTIAAPAPIRERAGASAPTPAAPRIERPAREEVLGLGRTAPDPRELWRRQLAVDPNQASMALRRYCRDPGLPDSSPEKRFALALGRLYDFAPTAARFRRAVGEVVDIRAQAERAYPRNFGYDPTDEDLPRLTDVPGQVERIVLHYTEGNRADLDGMAQAHLMSSIGRGTGYNYYVNDDGATSRVYWTSGQFVYHLRGDRDSLGIEAAACSQADVTSRQYERMLYLVADLLQSNGFLAWDRPVADVVDAVVVGHREYARAHANLDFPAVLAQAFRWRLIAFLVDELGYRP